MTTSATQPSIPAGTSSPTAAQTTRSRRLIWLSIGLIAAIGLFLRIWAIGRSPVDADSAVVGLMAREILHGHFFAFYWGQNYGGVEPYVVAVLFRLFGQSTFTLSFAPVVLDGLAAVLLWRIGRRLFSDRIGIASGLLFWVWPEVYLRESTIEHGFRYSCLVCGLLLLLIALQLCDGSIRSSRHRLLLWTSFGLAIGVGFWASPEIAYYLIPGVALLVWRALHHRLVARVVDLVAGLIAAIVGALPWLYDNLTKSFPSFRHSVQPNPPGPAFINHLKVFVVHVLPTVLGLRLRSSTQWLFPTIISVAIYVVVVAAVVLFLVQLLRGRQALVLVTFLVLFPLIYAFSPFTWFWEDSRYALYLAPMLSLAVIALVERVVVFAQMKSKRTIDTRLTGLGIAATVVVGLALTVGAAGSLVPYTTSPFAPLGRTSLTTWQRNASGVTTHTAAMLARDGIHDLIAGYWVAYPLAFSSQGQLTATDIAYSRYQPFVANVEDSADPAWLFVNPTDASSARQLIDASELDPGCAVLTDRCLTVSDFISFLSAHHISYRTYHASYFEAVVPSRKVQPDGVLSHFGVKTHA